MLNYCAGQEKQGHADAMATLKKFGTYDWMTTLFPAIWAEWTERGVTRYGMVAHSLKGETEAFLDREYERKQAKLDGAKMASCEAKWRSDPKRWTMTMYCYKND